MSALRTLPVVLAASLAASPGWAFPMSASERALTFAACAGRYSAEVEHDWLLHPGHSAEAEARRDAFLALLDAVTADAVENGLPPELPLATRIEEKAAQTALLHRAAFHLDPLASELAAAAATQRIKACGAWLLGT